jgi:ABC-type sulfate transport system permease subunit
MATLADKTLTDNYGYSLTDQDKQALTEIYNKDVYGDTVDGFVYNPATGAIEENVESMNSSISVNNVFIFIGWLIGLACSVLSIIFLAKKQGVEKFLNTIYNFSTAYLFIMPGILGMLILVFIPIIFTLILGFSSLPKYFTEINLARNMAGFTNFGTILGTFNLQDPRNFYYTLGFTLLYSVVSIALQVSIGVLVAVVLHQNNVRMKSFYQVAFMLPGSSRPTSAVSSGTISSPITGSSTNSRTCSRNRNTWHKWRGALRTERV